MYLTRMEGMVAAGRRAEYDVLLDRYFDLLRRQSGILAAAALRSHEAPAKHSILTRWQSPEAATAAMQDEALVALVQSPPFTEIFTPARPAESYEVLHYVTGHGRLEFVYLNDEIVREGPGNLAAFEESRGQAYRLRQQVGPGFALSMLARLLDVGNRLPGDGNRYLTIGAFSSQADYTATANQPELQRYWQDHATEHDLTVSVVKELQELVKTALPDPL